MRNLQRFLGGGYDRLYLEVLKSVQKKPKQQITLTIIIITVVVIIIAVIRLEEKGVCWHSGRQWAAVPARQMDHLLEIKFEGKAEILGEKSTSLLLCLPKIRHEMASN
jgi:hypothetical protein